MIHFIFLTELDDIVNYLNSGKTIVPDDFLNKRGKSLKISSMKIDNKIYSENSFLEDNFGEFYSNYSYVAIFVDSKFYNHFHKDFNFTFRLIDIGNPYCIFLDKNKSEIKNILEDIFTSELKLSFWVFDKFGKGFNDFLRLPILNFNHKEVESLFNKLTDLDFNDEKLNSLEKEISTLNKKLRIPKRRPEVSKKKYYVDERDKYFAIDSAKHSRHETNNESGHNIRCDILAKFRFGKKINELEHFDVTQGDVKHSIISGQFTGCHGQIQEIKKQTHINMFSNDYIS